MPTNNDNGSQGRSKAGNSPRKSKPTAKSQPAEIKPKVVPASKANEAKLAAPTPEYVSEAKPTVVGAMVGSMRSELNSVLLKVAAVVVVLLVVLLVAFGVLIYGYKSDNAAVKAVAEVIPYPVLSVNGHFVSYNSYMFEVDAEERAYQSNAKLNNQAAPNFNSASGKKLVEQIKQHAITKLETDELTDQLASKMGIKVTTAQVQGPINSLYEQYGGKATLLKTLNQIYGWNLSDLQTVVRQQLIAEDLQNKVSDDPSLSAASEAKAESLLAQIKSGADFSTLAKDNSQSSDASNGGNMGYFTKGQVPTDIYTAAAALKPGQVSGVIHDQYGYVIIKVLGTKPGGSIEAQEILIKNVDYNSYFQDQLKKAKIVTYVKV